MRSEECGIAVAVAGNFLRDGDVGARVESGQQVELLKYEADFALAHAGALCIGERGEVVAIQTTLPESALRQSAQQVEQSRLAAAGGPDDGNEFSFFHAEGDSAERGDTSTFPTR
jgi:hypothetical protein